LDKDLISHVGLHEGLYSAECGREGLIGAAGGSGWEDEFEGIALWSGASRLVLFLYVKLLAKIENVLE
jgi:hypothetical protein